MAQTNPGPLFPISATQSSILSVNASGIPLALRERPQWVLWRVENRGGTPTKIPYSTDGPPAKSNDPRTWAPFEAALGVFERCESGGIPYSGIGFVFSDADEFCGIDLDGCRDPETAEWSEWARNIIQDLDSYTELSPSGSGAKIFVRGKSPLASGKNMRLTDVESRGGKQAGIEIYDKLRYFTVTGKRLTGTQLEPMQRQTVLERYCSEWFGDRVPLAGAGGETSRATADSSLASRASQYIARMPVSVSGQGGHNAAFRVACVLVLGFGLSPEEAYGVMAGWNQACQPPWSEKELRHKLADANKKPGERNFLRNVPANRWDAVPLPNFAASTNTATTNTASNNTPTSNNTATSLVTATVTVPSSVTAIVTVPSSVTASVTVPSGSKTLAQSAKDYLEQIRAGKMSLMSLGLPDIDGAIGGGVELSEVIIIGARPSHGKTCVGLQAAYTAAGDGHPVLIISEEMGRLALGKRAIQYASHVPEDSWRHRESEVLTQLDEHFAPRSPIHVVESCGTVERAIEAIRHHVAQHAVEWVVVDYGQLLGSRGNNRYEQMSRTSIALRQIANELKLTMVILAQLNRAIESREKFIPRLSDLRDAGQWEQDADVILFLVWPHRLDSEKDPHEFLIFVAKNRNRPINAATVKCRFEPSRQMLLMENSFPAESEVEAWSDRYGDF